MSENPQTKLVTVNVDGRDVAVAEGLTMIEAAEAAGVEIPHYCYHPKLSVSGNCRMCLVEMGMPLRDRASGEAILDDEGKPKIGWMPRPAIACNSKVSPGLHIKTDTQMVRDCRNGVMEFLLVNHPLDCPICDQAGECRLQEFATDYGRGYSRFIEEKNVKPKRTVLGPRVMLDDERCILCSRCIRFMQEVAEDDVLGFVDRGSYSTLTCYPGKQLTSNYSLNTVDICPVGALTSRDFRFKMRVWFLKPVNSICTESSVGANTQVWQREGKIYRITPRRNDAVNDTWMTDSGRELYKQVESDARLRSARIGGEEKSLVEAIKRASALLADAKTVAVVASGHSSVEEQFALAELAKTKRANVFMLRHTGEEDGLLLSADRTPNTRGALLTRLTGDLPAADLSDLEASLAAGEVDALIVIREDVLAAGISSQSLGKTKSIFLGPLSNPTAEAADVVLPGLTVFENAGTFINQQFRLQKFQPVVPGPSGIDCDLQTIVSIEAGVRGEQPACVKPDCIWGVMAERISEFSGIRFADIPDEGLALDGAAFANLPFPEQKSLHYGNR